MAKSKKDFTARLKLARELVAYVKTIDDVVCDEYEAKAFVKTLNKCLNSIGASMDIINKNGDWSVEFEREMYSCAFMCGYLYRHEMSQYKDISIKLKGLK